MLSEAKNRKQCEREISAAYNQAKQEQDRKEQQRQYYSQLHAELEQAKQARDALADQAAALHDTDPEGEAFLCDYGEDLNEIVKLTERAIAIYDAHLHTNSTFDLLSKATQLLEGAASLIPEFKSTKSRKKLREKQERAKLGRTMSIEALRDELSIYTGRSLGAGSKNNGFREMVEAKIRQKQLDDLDD
ncbi:MAG: hypothetical protein K2M47_01455 [Clostridiales bacterium]|nr:hypothetical protein [Clostridiales bacterium]